MSDEQQTTDDEKPAYGDYDPELVAAVTAHQLTICTQVVPEALKIRLEHAAKVPAGQWRRTAGGDDPKVQRLEAPYRLFAPAVTKKAAAKKATGSRRRRKQ